MFSCFSLSLMVFTLKRLDRRHIRLSSHLKCPHRSLHRNRLSSPQCNHLNSLRDNQQIVRRFSTRILKQKSPLVNRHDYLPHNPQDDHLDYLAADRRPNPPNSRFVVLQVGPPRSLGRSRRADPRCTWPVPPSRLTATSPWPLPSSRRLPPSRASRHHR